jgi:hypothetical protein
VEKLASVAGCDFNWLLKRTRAAMVKHLETETARLTEQDRRLSDFLAHHVVDRTTMLCRKDLEQRLGKELAPRLEELEARGIVDFVKMKDGTEWVKLHPAWVRNNTTGRDKSRIADMIVPRAPSTPPVVKEFLNGRELMDRGVPGHKIGEVKRMLQRLREEGQIASREQALGMLPDVAAKLGIVLEKMRGVE